MRAVCDGPFMRHAPYTCTAIMTWLGRYRYHTTDVHTCRTFSMYARQTARMSLATARSAGTAQCCCRCMSCCRHGPAYHACSLVSVENMPRAILALTAVWYSSQAPTEHRHTPRRGAFPNPTKHKSRLGAAIRLARVPSCRLTPYFSFSRPHDPDTPEPPLHHTVHASSCFSTACTSTGTTCVSCRPIVVPAISLPTTQTSTIAVPVKEHINHCQPGHAAYGR